MNILISGITCSGKSTLAKSIPNSPILEQDSYFKDLKDIGRYKGYYLFDSPSAFYTDEFIKDARDLLNGKSINIPLYDKRTNRRINKEENISPNQNNIIEGLHVIDLLKDTDTLKIFIDVSMEEILRRKINRDKEFGISREEVERYFETVVIPMYKTYIESQKKYADYIIESESDKLCLLKKLV